MHTTTNDDPIIDRCSHSGQHVRNRGRCRSRGDNQLANNMSPNGSTVNGHSSAAPSVLKVPDNGRGCVRGQAEGGSRRGGRLRIRERCRGRKSILYDDFSDSDMLTATADLVDK